MLLFVRTDHILLLFLQEPMTYIIYTCILFCKTRALLIRVRVRVRVTVGAGVLGLGLGLVTFIFFFYHGGSVRPPCYQNTGYCHLRLQLP